MLEEDSLHGFLSGIRGQNTEKSQFKAIFCSCSVRFVVASVGFHEIVPLLERFCICYLLRSRYRLLLLRRLCSLSGSSSCLRGLSLSSLGLRIRCLYWLRLHLRSLSSLGRSSRCLCSLGLRIRSGCCLSWQLLLGKCSGSNDCCSKTLEHGLFSLEEL